MAKCKICGKEIPDEDKLNEEIVVKQANRYVHVSCLEKEEEEEKEQQEDTSKDDMLAKLQEQINAMQLAMSMMGGQGNVVLEQNKDLTRSVKVTSLLPNLFYLTTEKYGKGEPYEFRGIGTTNVIPFTSMQKILSVHKSQFEKGYAILESEKDYEDLGISYIYGKVLTEDKLNKLVKLQGEEAVSLILSLDESFQEKICSVIAENVVGGIVNDWNKIDELEDNGLEIKSLIDELKAEKKAKEEQEQE